MLGRMLGLPLAVLERDGRALERVRLCATQAGVKVRENVLSHRLALCDVLVHAALAHVLILRLVDLKRDVRALEDVRVCATQDSAEASADKLVRSLTLNDGVQRATLGCVLVPRQKSSGDTKRDGGKA